MNFQEAENYLLSLGNEVSTMKLGLANIRTLLEALGDPQKKYLKVQVAGTNGKGSVCAFLNSICVTAGIRTGMFTSPHLVSITERVKIDDVYIGEDEFAGHATQVLTASERLVDTGNLENIPTFFEHLTAIALLAFAKANVELAILETGLGGRLDATTSVNAEIAAITRIDYDHQQYLGETLEEIAAEKAAIIRPGMQVIVGEQYPVAMNVLHRRCREAGVEPLLASEIILPSVPLGLAGEHQVENAKIAIAATRFLQDRFSITRVDIDSGLAAANHPGRLERIGQFLLDGSHNAGGAKALRKYIDEFVHQPITLVFGAMGDKNVKEIVSILFPAVNSVVLTRPTNTRAMQPEQVVELVPSDLDRDIIYLTRNVPEAIVRARQVAGSTDVILVTGSLYVVGEARQFLLNAKHKTEN